MARTGHDGPDYGALGTLCQFSDDPAVSQTDLEIYEVTVPADEDWYVKQVIVYCKGAGATPTATVDVEDDTVSMLTGAVTCVAATPANGVLTANPLRVAASSAVTIDVTTGTTAPTDLTVWLVGYRRFIGAPRGRTNPLS